MGTTLVGPRPLTLISNHDLVDFSFGWDGSDRYNDLPIALIVVSG